MDDLHWEPMSPWITHVWLLRLGPDEVARVLKRADGAGWVSTVARHRQNYARRLSARAPSKSAAMRWAEAWCQANLATIRAELPVLVCGPAGIRVSVYPPCNPPSV